MMKILLALGLFWIPAAHASEPCSINPNATEVDARRDCGIQGVAGESQRIAAAFEQICATNPLRKLHFPAGNYTISQPLRCARTAEWMQWRLTGDGSAKTRFIWTGDAPEDAILRFDSHGNSVYSGFSVIAQGRAKTAIDSRNVKAHGGTNTFADIVIEGRDQIRYGVRIYNIEAANNEFTAFERVRISGYAETAFSIEHSQAKTIRFFDSECHAGAAGKACVSTAHGTVNGGEDRGSFMWFGGKGSGHKVADFILGNCSDASIIMGATFTGSDRFLINAYDATVAGNIREMGGAGHAWAFTIDSVVWKSGNLNPDGRVLNFVYRGPLIIRNSTFGDDASKPLWFEWVASDGIGAFQFENNRIMSGLSDVFFRDAGKGRGNRTPPTGLRDNLIRRENGNWEKL